jgi:hypothetical protein
MTSSSYASKYQVKDIQFIQEMSLSIAANLRRAELPPLEKTKPTLR